MKINRGVFARSRFDGRFICHTSPHVPAFRVNLQYECRLIPAPIGSFLIQQELTLSSAKNVKFPHVYGFEGTDS